MVSFKSAKLDKSRNVIELKYPNDISLLSKLSSLDGFTIRYKHSEISANENSVKKLKELGFVLSASLMNYSDKEMQKVRHVDLSKMKSVLPLYDYQKQGVMFIENKNGRALIADEMGLGKTVQALSWLNLHPDKRPAIVICPSSLKVNWYRECKKWIVGSNPEILESTKSYKTHGDILVINYDILHGWIERLKKINPQVIIADEAQYIKNPKAKRTTAFKKLNRSVDHLIGLTGTPIDNKPVELYSIISSINPTIFPNYYSYVYKFCGGKRNPWGGIDTSEATNKEELHRILKNTIMIRRMKSEVMKELPPKQIVKVPLSISNRPLYTKAENEFIQYLNIRYNKINDDLKEELKNFAKRHKIEVSDELDDSEIAYLKSLKLEKASALGQIEYLKQIAIDGKMDEIINWIETFLESGEKLVVFAIHKRIIKKLIETFPDCVYIHGGVSKKHRQQAIDDFQNNSKVQLFIANMQSAGVGITLTSASNIAIIQYPWSPSIINQAIDRVHRITQIHQVTAWMLVAENTIEEKIIDVLKKKEQVISQIIDGKEYEDISVVMELVDSYRKIKK